MIHAINRTDRTLRSIAMVTFSVVALGAFAPATPELTFGAAIGALYFGMTAIVGMDPVRSAWLYLGDRVQTQSAHAPWSNAVPS